MSCMGSAMAGGAGCQRLPRWLRRYASRTSARWEWAGALVPRLTNASTEKMYGPGHAVVDHARTSSFVSAAVAVASIPRARSASTNVPGEAAPGPSLDRDRPPREIDFEGSHVPPVIQLGADGVVGCDDATPGAEQRQLLLGRQPWVGDDSSVHGGVGSLPQHACRAPPRLRCRGDTAEVFGPADTSLPRSVAATNDKTVTVTGL